MGWWPASILGALVTFVLSLTSLPPSIEDLERSAAEMVLPDSQLTHVGANTGATFVVGWERWAVSDFEHDQPAQQVHSLLVARAEQMGWTVEETVPLPHGSSIELERPFLTARVLIGAQLERGERTEASAGHVTVARNEGQRFVLFWGLVAAGAILPPLASRWIWHPERRESRPDIHPASPTRGGP